MGSPPRKQNDNPTVPSPPRVEPPPSESGSRELPQQPGFPPKGSLADVLRAGSAPKAPPVPSMRRRPSSDDAVTHRETGAVTGEGNLQLGDIDIQLDASFGSSNPPPPKRVSSSPPPELPAICDFGRFQILGRIAFGGMAEIFLAREETAAGATRNLAIKRVLPHVADDDQFVEMFLDEARLTIQLNHPSICHIYEFGQLEGSHFIAMEWVNGMPLGKVIRRARAQGGFPPEIVCKIIADIAGALHYAHRARDNTGQPMVLIHRDVSPHNIMISYDGNVKLLDFGIAKSRMRATMTEAGVIKGKFSYMSPQQCLGEKIDQRADIFALGVCFYEALTGKPLYHRKTEYETMRAVIEDPVPSLQEVRPDLPASIEPIVRKALAKSANERYQTAGDMQAALLEWLADQRIFVNSNKVAAMMESLYGQEMRRGPLVDSTPFGQSFIRRAELGREASQKFLTSTGSEVSAEGLALKQLRRRLAIVTVVVLPLVLLLGVVAYTRVTAHEEPMTVVGENQPPPDPGPPDPGPAPVPDPEPVPPTGPVTPPPALVGSLRVESTPAGASVQLDGNPVDGVTPLTLEGVAVGSHEVTISRRGLLHATETVEVASDALARVRATLRAGEPAAPPGRLSINTRPWSKVYVRGRLLGTTPIGGSRVPSGVVGLRLVDRDGRTHNRTVRVEPGGEARVFFDLSR